MAEAATRNTATEAANPAQQSARKGRWVANRRRAMAHRSRRGRSSWSSRRLGEVDEQVLEGDRAEVEAGVAGLAAVPLVEAVVDHGRLGPAELALAQHGAAGHEPVHRLGCPRESGPSFMPRGIWKRSTSASA
jgi:hypothetical protein